MHAQFDVSIVIDSQTSTARPAGSAIGYTTGVESLRKTALTTHPTTTFVVGGGLRYRVQRDSALKDCAVLAHAPRLERVSRSLVLTYVSASSAGSKKAGGAQALHRGH